jgi:hypothetical protein
MSVKRITKIKAEVGVGEGKPRECLHSVCMPSCSRQKGIPPQVQGSDRKLRPPTTFNRGLGRGPGRGLGLGRRPRRGLGLGRGRDVGRGLGRGQGRGLRLGGGLDVI